MFRTKSGTRFDSGFGIRHKKRFGARFWVGFWVGSKIGFRTRWEIRFGARFTQNSKSQVGVKSWSLHDGRTVRK